MAGLARLIYVHNCSRRIAIDSKPAAIEALAAIGWPDGPGWQPIRPRRFRLGPGLSWDGPRSQLGKPVWQMSAAKHSSRKPSPGHPLHDLNRKHGMLLYGLAVEETPEGFAFDLSGVRSSDVDHLLGDVLGLGPDAWHLEYFRRAEVYAVLSPGEAHRLAVALGGRERKDSTFLHLLEGHPVNLIIRTRTRATARLHVYMMHKGPTTAFRVELSLAGRTEDRGQFGDVDVDRLADALKAIIKAHDLHPLEKPDLWEPLDRDRHVPRDSLMARIPKATIEGMAPDSLPKLPKCNTPSPLILVDHASGTWVSLPEASITGEGTDEPTNPKGRAMGPDPIDLDPSPLVSLYLPNRDPNPPVRPLEVVAPALAPAIARAGNVLHVLGDEVVLNPGLLYEVVIGSDDDPILVVTALARAAAGHGRSVSVETLGDGFSAWGSLDDLEFVPVGADHSDVRVVVVDVSALAAGARAVTVWDPKKKSMVCREKVLGALVRGPLAHWAVDTDPQHAQVRVLASRLAPTLKAWRDRAERTGQTVVLVTVDARPSHGREFRPLPNYMDKKRDQRVRSIIGDAGRHYCAQRYHVERFWSAVGAGYQTITCGQAFSYDLHLGHTVTCWRDSIHGRPGRVLGRSARG